MAITKASLVITGRDTNSEDIKFTIGYVNPEIVDATDTAVATAGRVRLKNFAQAVMGLTTNSFLRAELQTTEDITTAAVEGV